jgi:hypothetical protein
MQRCLLQANTLKNIRKIKCSPATPAINADREVFVIGEWMARMIQIVCLFATTVAHICIEIKN